MGCKKIKKKGRKKQEFKEELFRVEIWSEVSRETSLPVMERYNSLTIIYNRNTTPKIMSADIALHNS